MQIAHLGNFAAERPGQIDPLGWRGYGAARFRPIERQTGRNRKAFLPPFAASQSRFRRSLVFDRPLFGSLSFSVHRKNFPTKKLPESGFFTVSESFSSKNMYYA